MTSIQELLFKHVHKKPFGVQNSHFKRKSSVEPCPEKNPTPHT